MKFKKGQKKIDIPPIGELLGASLQRAALDLPLQVVHMEEIQKMRKRYPKEEAWPMMAAHALGVDEVHLWPTPHKGGEVKIRFYPPVQEI